MPSRLCGVETRGQHYHQGQSSAKTSAKLPHPPVCRSRRSPNTTLQRAEHSMCLQQRSKIEDHNTYNCCNASCATIQGAHVRKERPTRPRRSLLLSRAQSRTHVVWSAHLAVCRPQILCFLCGQDVHSCLDQMLWYQSTRCRREFDKHGRVLECAMLPLNAEAKQDRGLVQPECNL